MGAKERRAREKERRELEIIEGAAELFMERGYAHTTMDDIVDRLELSKGALYHHFQSKDELLYAVAAKGLDVFRQMVLDSMAGKANGLEKVTAIGHAYVSFYLSQPQYRKIFGEIALAAPPSGPWGISFAQVGERTTALMVGAIEEGIKDGSIRPDVDPPQLAFIASSAFEGVLNALDRRKPRLKGEGLDQREVLRTTFDIFRTAITARAERTDLKA